MKPPPFDRWIQFCFACLCSGAAHAAPTGYTLENAFPALHLPDCVSTLAVTPGSSGREVAGMQRGLMIVLPADRSAAEAPVFLDFRQRLKEETAFEEGLHGLAFHPDFAKNRKFYLSYSQQSPRRSILSEFCVKPGTELVADPASERILLELPHPMGDHWGGTIAFGPDGFLYLGIGDGGLRDDPYGLAQNPWALQGKILRLDVDTRTGALPYGIPRDNPYVQEQAIRDEIWASGLRNPWGLSFDSKTGQLWVADVGQDIWEEINLVQKGGNYGWSQREGPTRFMPRTALPEPESPLGPYLPPLHAYMHNEGISITGGFVYRGQQNPELEGQYLFGDWGHGKVWRLKRHATPAKPPTVRLIFEREGEDDAHRFNPTVIAADARGEILLGSHHPPTIFRLHRLPVLAEDDTAPDEEGEPAAGPPAPLLQDGEVPGNPENESS